jgi:hypothetical protein
VVSESAGGVPYHRHHMPPLNAHITSTPKCALCMSDPTLLGWSSHPADYRSMRPKLMAQKRNPLQAVSLSTFESQAPTHRYTIS